MVYLTYTVHTFLQKDTSTARTAGVSFLLSKNNRGENVELTQITTEIYEASKRLSKGSDALFLLAKANAEAEREYRNALAKEIMRLKIDGLQATLISDVARGNTADLKFNRDLADAKYTSGRDSLKAIATQVTALQSILKFQSEV